MNDLDQAIADLETLKVNAFITYTDVEAQPGVISVPSPHYTERMDRLWRALAFAGFDPLAYLDYTALHHRFGKGVEDPATIDRMTADDLRHLAVRFKRGEHFCDGYWASLIASGAFLALLRRARALRDAGEGALA